VNNILLAFNVRTPESFGVTFVGNIYYNADWLPNKTIVDDPNEDTDMWTVKFLEHNATYNIPDGEHNITVVANGGGGYLEDNIWYTFGMTTVSVITFAVDTATPRVTISSAKNKTYTISDVPLKFVTSEIGAQIAYALDGQKNVTIDGNTTLTGLTTGAHNLTVYAWDAAGNVGASETIIFTIAEPEPEPFPIKLVAASGASATLISIGLGFTSGNANIKQSVRLLVCSLLGGVARRASVQT
jgi:hypothetical protein